MTESNNDSKRLARRDFFRKAGAGTLGIAAAGFAVGVGPATAASAAAPAHSGYRETDHVRRVYELARF